MAGGGAPDGELYSPAMAFVYTFNLIIGVGAISMPQGFQLAGLDLSTLLLLFVSFFAYVSVTYVIEAMANANAYAALTKDEEAEEHDDEEQPILSRGGDADSSSINVAGGGSKLDPSDPAIFEIRKRFEMGTMANMFCGKTWETIFYIILVVYLYGDLAIYAVAVPSSLQSITEDYLTGKEKLAENMYYLYLLAFAVVIVPFCFLNFQKTKYLQYTTITTRNVAMITIVVLCWIRLAGEHKIQISRIRYFDVTRFPDLFGIVVYAFMCHHSLPSIITPVDNKRNITTTMAYTYCAVIFVYFVLNYSAVLALGDPCSICYDGEYCGRIDDLITQAFTDFSVDFIAIFLNLYPVLTLSTNYPLISITLRNNLMNLITYGENGPYRKWRPFLFSAVSAIPPILLAFATQNVDKLVSITGAYGGVGIQWLIPVILIFKSRAALARVAPDTPNPYRSMFHHKAWLYAILVLVVVSVAISTVNIVFGFAGINQPKIPDDNDDLITYCHEILYGTDGK